MICSVQLNKATWDRQRNTLTRHVEQVIQQRAASISQSLERDPAWVEWAARHVPRISITATVLDSVVPAVLDPDPRLWTLEVPLIARDYETLPLGPAVTLRFVQTLEAVLSAIAVRLEGHPPVHLGRIKREVEWLSGGGVDPGPGAAAAMRIRQASGPMPEARFWSVIASTTDEFSGAFRLRGAQVNRFTARMRLLVDALDSERHRAASEAVLGFVSDDVWEDVRAWAVALGKQSYRRITDVPEFLGASLSVLKDQDDLSFGERLLHLEGGD